MESDVPTMPKQAKGKWDGIVNLQNYKTKTLASQVFTDSLVHQQWHSVIEIYKNRLLLRYAHHDLQSDLMNNMDHTRISGTEPS